MARKFLKFNNCLLAHQKFLFQKISGGKPIFLLARLERTLRRTQCKLEGMWLGNLVMVSTRRKRPPDHNSMQHSLAKGQSCSSNATLPHPTISAGRLPGMHTCLLRLWGGYKPPQQIVHERNCWFRGSALIILAVASRFESAHFYHSTQTLYTHIKILSSLFDIYNNVVA